MFEKGETQQQGCQRSHFPARGWSVLWACRRTSELGPYWEPSGSVLITNHIHQKDTFSNSSDTSLQQRNNLSSVYVSLSPGRYDWQWQSLYRHVGCIVKAAEQFLVFFPDFFLNFKSSRLLPIRSSNNYSVSSNFDNNFIIKMYGPSSPLLPVWGVGTEWAARTRAQLINHELVDHLHLSSNF